MTCTIKSKVSHVRPTSLCNKKELNQFQLATLSRDILRYLDRICNFKQQFNSFFPRDEQNLRGYSSSPRKVSAEKVDECLCFIFIVLRRGKRKTRCRYYGNNNFKDSPSFLDLCSNAGQLPCRGEREKSPLPNYCTNS